MMIGQWEIAWETNVNEFMIIIGRYGNYIGYSLFGVLGWILFQL